MNSKKLLLISAAAVAVIILIIAAFVIITGSSGRDHEVKLPEEREASPETHPGEEPAGLVRVEVNTETVRSVIETLSRPDEYSRELNVTNYWHGGSSVYRIESFVSGEDARIRTSSGFDVRNVLMADGKTYIWYGDGPSVSVGGGAAADQYQMLVTYEDILSLSDGSILDAGYEEFDGRDCIFAVYESGELGYTTKCYVSVQSGLAVGAEKYDGDTLIYSMKETSCTVGPPPDGTFTPPDGAPDGQQ